MLKQRIINHWLPVFAAFLVLLSGATSFAAEIPFEGHLEKDGAPYTSVTVAEGSSNTPPIDVTFLLFTVAEGGTAVYEEVEANVMVYGGKFSAIIGPTATNSTTLESIILAHPNLYIGLKIRQTGGGDDAPFIDLSGRQKIMAVPQALNAKYHANVPLVDIKNHATHADTVVMWYGPIANIPAGWQLCDNNNGTPDLQNKFIRGTPANGTGHTLPGGTDTIAQHTHSTAVGLNNFAGSVTSDSKSHTHSVPLNETAMSNVETESGSDEEWWGRHNHPTSPSTSSSHSHEHSVSLNHNHASQTFTSSSTASHDNKPGYVALAYICKL